MADYKVIYRDDEVKWQEGCPILIEAVQVSRDTQSAKTFLQLKVRNVSGEKISAIAIDARIEAPDGITQTISVTSLDADIAPNKEYSPQAVALSISEIESVDVRLTRVDDVTDFRSGIHLPELTPVSLSTEALAERDEQIRLMGISPEKLKYEAVQSDSWWRCSCGALNSGTVKCIECGLNRDKLTALEDEQALLAQSIERKYEQAKQALSGSSIAAIEEAKTILAEMPDYKDAKDLLPECDDVISTLKAAKSRKVKIAIIAGVAVAVIAVVLVLIFTVFLPSSRINEAMRLAENGQYEEAKEMLVQNDAEDRIPEVIQMEADAAVETGDYERAIELYDSINNVEAANRTKMTWADSLYEEGSYQEALPLYQQLSNYEGVFNCAKKYAESGDYTQAIELMTPLIDMGIDGVQDELNEAKYNYILANRNDTDENTCKYLLELKDLGYRDTADIFENLYTLSVSRGELKNTPAGLYNNLRYTFTVTGVMPGGLDERTLTIVSDVKQDQTVNLAYRDSGSRVSLTFSEKIDGGAHSAHIRVVDNSTGAVLLEDTVSF